MLASRLAGFGTTIFTEMSALAERTGSINLGQGFPDEDGPSAVLEAAVQAIRDGHNQYAPLPGVPALVDAIAEHQRARYGLEHEAIQVTFGATEAITATLLGLCEPGDEVVALDPFYDSYRAGAALAGARLVGVPLTPPEWRFDPEQLAAAITPRTRVLLLNSPHNPTGRVLDRAELEQIAAACVEHDLIAISDEVYEHLVFEGEHVPLATLPGMAERTLTVSSIGKTFSVTGWKTGWACGPAELVAATRGAKQFMTFAGGTPFQHAAATALASAEEHGARLAAELKAKRDRICAGLERAGATVLRPAGTYFVNADVRPLGYDDGVAFCRELPKRAGVVAIPTSVFCGDPERVRSLVRFAFCKREEVIDEAATRLGRLRSG
jgi:N-succinyldiaminopimelate aminotransferase